METPPSKGRTALAPIPAVGGATAPPGPGAGAPKPEPFVRP
jgi:hypothetical protein